METEMDTEKDTIFGIVVVIPFIFINFRKASIEQKHVDFNNCIIDEMVTLFLEQLKLRPTITPLNDLDEKWRKCWFSL